MAGTYVGWDPQQDDEKDRERAASMADEGGASGAYMDAREQLGATPQPGPGGRARHLLWMWGAAAAGLALGGAALARTIRGRHGANRGSKSAQRRPRRRRR